MTTLDIISLVVIILFTVGGIASGFITKIGKFVGRLGGLAAAYFIATPINTAFHDNGYYASIIDAFNGNENFASGIMLVVIYIVIAIIVSIIIEIIIRCFKNLVHKSKILAVIDRLIGGAFGACFSLFLISVVFLVINLIMPSVDSLNTWMLDQINHSCGIASNIFNFATSVFLG